MGANLYQLKDIPDLTIGKVHDLYRKYVNAGQVDLIASFGFGRELVDYAEGVWIYTKNKRKILDVTGGIGVLNHGHNHPRILKARIEYQNNKSMEVHKNYFSPSLAALSSNIASLLPGDLNISYFPNSGAEAVEGALKMAFKYNQGKRRTVLYSDIAFHGKLLGAASVTGSPELSFKFPQIPNTVPFVYNDIKSVKQLVNKNTINGKSDVYAIIIEPFNASSLRQCNSGFLKDLREMCYKEDIVLIFDEVYSGWAKTGRLFHFMYHDVMPDILIYAKSFGGGKASISGYTCRDNIFKKAYGNLNDATLHSTTYNGFGEETFTALEAVNILIEENYVSRSSEIFEYLNPKLRELQNEYPDLVQEVRGSGSLNGILLNVDSKIIKSVTKMIPSEFFQDERFLPKLITGAVISELYNTHGILSFYGSNRDIPLIISPSIVIKNEELDFLIESLDKTLSQGYKKLLVKFIKSKFFKR